MLFNTGETGEDLKLKYNPDGSMLRKMQLRLLDMLLYLDKVCKEQNITWRLDGGNILGAVRHGGFIPWDDDVDVVLEKKEFKRLCKYLLEHPHPQYKLQCNKTDKGYYCHGWATLRDMNSEYIQDSRLHNARKYRGAQIDLFRYENHINRRLGLWFGRIETYNIQHFVGIKPQLAQLVYYMQEYVTEPIFKLLGYPFSSSKEYAHSYGFVHCHIPSDVLIPYRPILFEGHEFPGPAQPDLFLKLLYGDYLELPPIEKRGGHDAKYKIWD